MCTRSARGSKVGISARRTSVRLLGGAILFTPEGGLKRTMIDSSIATIKTAARRGRLIMVEYVDGTTELWEYGNANDAKEWFQRTVEALGYDWKAKRYPQLPDLWRKPEHWPPPIPK